MLALKRRHESEVIVTPTKSNNCYHKTTSLITSYGTLHLKKKKTLYMSLQIGDMSPTGRLRVVPHFPQG